MNDVSLAIERGEFVAVTGPSGSGKTTLLSILGGMTEPTEGQVMIKGTDLYRLSADSRADFRAQNIGFVFQQLHLLPYLSALENVMLPLVIISGGSKRERALAALARVGLEGKERRLPGALSVGEQARVGIARALVREPSLILADEPTGNLDSQTGGEIVELLSFIHRRGHTVIIVTHSPAAASAAERTISLLDGRMIRYGGSAGVL
ncbi:MAG: ABC transporter ATP-binding protein [Chloroflexota bacterium]|nr:ABC transporter ATP-binding protein [Chloroflexota bacterium]